jgi:hypothetical protein
MGGPNSFPKTSVQSQFFKIARLGLKSSISDSSEVLFCSNHAYLPAWHFDHCHVDGGPKADPCIFANNP